SLRWRPAIGRLSVAPGTIALTTTRAHVTNAHNCFGNIQFVSLHVINDYDDDDGPSAPLRATHLATWPCSRSRSYRYRCPHPFAHHQRNRFRDVPRIECQHAA